MTELSIIFNLLFFALMTAGLVGGWFLHRRLQAFRATLPELGKTISTLNASILHAEATIAQLQSLAGAPHQPADSKPPLGAGTRQALMRGGLDGMRDGALEALIASIARNKQEARP